METGFFTHDEEHFSSSFYGHGHGLEDSEGSLFGGIIDSELDYPGSHFDQLPTLWDPADDDHGTISQEGDSLTSPIDCKEDFQQMLTDWHEHLSCLQVPEPMKLLPILRTDSIAINSHLPTDIPDILFTNSVGNNLSAPSMDDLFPLELQTEEVDITTDEQEHNSFSMTPKLDIVKSESLKEESLEDIVSGSELLPKLKPSLIEVEEDSVDVETVGEQMPVLEAGDLTSLLEQFEASEVVNGSIDKLPSVLESHLYAMAAQQLLISPTSSSPPHANVPFPSHQSIRESLPQEVIDRIKASRRKMIIPVIPAIPPKKSGRAATRMQDAGFALSRNKLLKLVTVGSTGESVQLDHDYCTSADNTLLQTYYQSDGSEISSQSSTPELTYSRFPDFYVSLSQQKPAESRPFKETWAEKNSKKDSGLESGDVSDASEETQVINTNETNTKGKVVLKSVTGIKSVNLVTENGLVIGSAAMKDRKEMTMVSVLKKFNLNNLPVQNNVSVSSSVSTSTSTISTSTSMDKDNNESVRVVEPVKKRKLNLEEYRVRREERERKRSQENSRSSSPSMCAAEIQPDSTTSTQDDCTTQKPVMHSVEVQTQTNDFLEVDLKRSKDQSKAKSERDHNRDKRSDARRRSYRARHVSSSSSSSSGESGRHRSHRKRRDSRSDRHYKSTTSRMWSRSRSRSSSRTNCSSCSSHSRSRSRSRDSRRIGKRHNHSPRHSYNNKPQIRREIRRWQRPKSPSRPVRNQEWDGAEKLRQVEERRVIYVGRIDEGTTKAHLRARFEVFGPIVDISVHFRERGDNYGFVTFAYKVDAYEAVEHGNDDPSMPHYDLCFGGRRAFCKQRYADLDGATNNSTQYSPYQVQRTNDSFDLLLREAQAKLRKRSSV